MVHYLGNNETNKSDRTIKADNDASNDARNRLIRFCINSMGQNEATGSRALFLPLLLVEISIGEYL